MKKISRDELNEVLRLHRMWVNGECGGERANLRGVDLRGVDLREANLRGANLRIADLREANLRRVDLREANLRGVDLRGANLRGANLSEAKNLDTVLYNENTSFFALQCPEEGDFIGWKKCTNGAIVKLLITGKRSSATSRKCRCSEAKVLEISGGLTEVESTHDYDFIYRLGETVSIPDFDENRWNECSTGIHFFLTRKEAEQYDL